MTNMSLQEAMAIAVLKGDFAGAYALADLLTEDRDAMGLTKREEEAAIGIGVAYTGTIHVTGHQVYHWPEFQALLKRLGVMWASYNQETVIRLTRDRVVIERTDLGRDMSTIVEVGTC